MINAAEPIDIETLREFYRLFRKLKLPQGVVFPTYGLAEHTVFVCSGGKTVLQVTKASIEASGKIAIVSEETIDDYASDKAAASTFSSSNSSSNSSGSSGEGKHLNQYIVSCGNPSRYEFSNLKIYHYMYDMYDFYCKMSILNIILLYLHHF